MSTKFVSRGAERYDSYMGRWSRRLAPPFIEFAGLAAGERVLDVGCGTGSLTFALPNHANIASIEAIDYEQQFVNAACERNSDPRIHFQKGDACELQFADGQFDRALSMLVLHFLTNPDRAVSEMRRVVRSSGVAAATVWDNFGGQPAIRMFWDTLAAIEPGAAGLRDASLLRATTRPGELAGIFAKTGFNNVVETALNIRMEFANFDDYWIPMTTGQGAQGAYLESLPEATRQRVVEAVKAAYLCGHADGPRSFVSLAWAVRGTVPAH
jgi:ubiquinone/menaquinone biosynthesis C-methylase UbiE